MDYKLEEKKQTTVHKVLNLTLITLFNVSLNSDSFSRLPTYHIIKHKTQFLNETGHLLP